MFHHAPYIVTFSQPTETELDQFGIHQNSPVCLAALPPARSAPEVDMKSKLADTKLFLRSPVVYEFPTCQDPVKTGDIMCHMFSVNQI